MFVVHGGRCIYEQQCQYPSVIRSLTISWSSTYPQGACFSGSAQTDCSCSMLPEGAESARRSSLMKSQWRAHSMEVCLGMAAVRCRRRRVLWLPVVSPWARGSEAKGGGAPRDCSLSAARRVESMN